MRLFLPGNEHTFRAVFVNDETLKSIPQKDRGDVNKLTTLIIVAHPDDESIGAGARLRKLGDAWVVDVTDGAPRDVECARRHGYDTPEEYAAARRTELEQQLARLDDLLPSGTLGRVVDGEHKISFWGNSYGSYLGTAYASLFPERTDRVLLSSVASPTRMWRGQCERYAGCRDSGIQRATG